MSLTKQAAREKEKIVRQISSEMKESNGVIFYRFSKIANEEIFSLKRSLVDSCKWSVFKNTLFQKALFFGQKIDSKLVGNNAFIFCRRDYYEPLRILRRFDLSNDREGSIQGGLFEGQIIDKETITEWSKLKAKESYFIDLAKYLTMVVEKQETISKQEESQAMNLEESKIGKKINEVIDFLGTLTPPHISKLVDLFREKYNLDNVSSSEEVLQNVNEEVKTFSLELHGAGNNKIAVFNVVKKITGKSIIEVMKQFKDASEGKPVQIIAGLDEEIAKSHKEDLEKCGATVVVK